MAALGSWAAVQGGLTLSWPNSFCRPSVPTKEHETLGSLLWK